MDSSRGNGLVKQEELSLVWRLKDRCPLFEVRPSHRCSAPFARRVASLSSLDQILERRIEVMQFNSHPQSPSSESFLVAFSARPMAPLQNHALALREELLGKRPQLSFNAVSKLFVPHIGAESRYPFVSIEPDRRNPGSELARQCRLARGGKTTDQNEPRR